jgi:hypothetical protein
MVGRGWRARRTIISTEHTDSLQYSTGKANTDIACHALHLVEPLAMSAYTRSDFAVLSRDHGYLPPKRIDLRRVIYRLRGDRRAEYILGKRYLFLQPVWYLAQPRLDVLTSYRLLSLTEKQHGVCSCRFRLGRRTRIPVLRGEFTRLRVKTDDSPPR